MATDAENIATIKSNALAILAEITASPKPSYSIDGQSVSWTEYHAMLMGKVAWADGLLGGLDPYEIHSEAYT